MCIGEYNVTTMYMYVFMLTSYLYFIFFFKQKTAYEMRISDWSSDVCSSDLQAAWATNAHRPAQRALCIIGNTLQLSAAAGQHDLSPHRPDKAQLQIGRESCRERGCQYV